MRALAIIAKTFALLVVFALSLLFGVLLHIGLGAPRRLATAEVNNILVGMFKGTITLLRVDILELDRVDGVYAEVLDPEKKRVLTLQGVRVRFEPLTLMRSLIGGKALEVHIVELTIDGVEVVVEDNAAGEIGLTRAFDSAKPATPGGAGTDVTAQGIKIRHIWAHGHLAAAPIIDADIDDFAGSLVSTPKTTDLKVDHLLERARGLGGMSPEGTLAASASMPADPNAGKHASVHYEGRLGAVPITANGSLDDKTVNAVVDVPETDAAALSALAPDKIHLAAAVKAHAEVHGQLPLIHPALQVWVGEGELTASADVTLPEGARTELTANAHVDAKNLDLSVLQEGSPASRLSATLDASVISRPAGVLSGTFHLESDAGEVSGQVAPAVSARGSFTDHSAQGTAQVAERGAPASVEFSLEPRAPGASPDQLAVKVDLDVADFNGVPRIGKLGRGSAHARVEGTMDLTTKALAGTAAVALSGVDMKGVQLVRGVVRASAHGTLDAPHVDANVVGQGLHTAGYGWVEARLGATGDLHRLDVTADLEGDELSPSVKASARLLNQGAPEVLDARVGLQRGDVTSDVTVASVRMEGGAIDLRGLQVLGLGEPIVATARVAGGGVRVKAKAADVDLQRVTTLFAREEDARGHLAFDIDATATSRAVSGSVDVTMKGLTARGVHDATVHVASEAKGSHVRAEASASLGDVGSVSLSAPDVVLGAGMTSVASLKKATGSVALQGRVNLEKLLAQVPQGMLPVDKASGTIVLKGSASRTSLTASPALTFNASTNDLLLVGQQDTHKNADGSLTLGPEPMRIAGLDGSFGIALEGATGRTKLSTELHDTHGALASFEANATLPLTELEKSPDRLMAVLRDLPVDVRLAVPRRSLDTMPPALGALPAKGDVELTASLQGTMRAPKLKLSAKGTNLVPRVTKVCAVPVNVEATVGYDAAKADVSITASSAGAQVMKSDATVKVNVADALAAGALAWQASGNVALTSFPLATVGGFLRQPLGGNLSGKVAITDLHSAAGLEADLDLKDLTLDKAAFPTGKVKIGVKDGAIAASVRLDQSDGFFETTAKGAMTWGSALAPAFDAAKPFDVDLHAKNFSLDAAKPFVQSAVAELDGRVDADAKVHVEPGFKDGHMNGAITLRDVAFEIPSVGERFHGLQGTVAVKPWGTIQFDKFAADGPTGHFTATASAVVKGLALQSATANIQIAKGQSIPIAFEGVPMGRAYGNITTKATMAPDGKRLDVEVDIPTLHVDLPQSTGHSVQDLALDNTVRTGLHVKNDFVLLPLVAPEKPRPPSDQVIHVAITLGKDVEVKRDTTVDVVANGKVTVDVTDKAHVGGSINLDRGKLELEGKVFTIDHGVVSFVGNDPSDPLIVATAYWDAPGSTRVYGEFSGHVSSGKLKLSSEPALTQDEILSLVMFGSADGSFGAQPPPGQEESAEAKAAGVAGGALTEGVNKAISGITSADISTRVDTSDANDPTPQVAVQLTKSVSASVAYKLGVPAPGEAPDRTDLTVNWRFIRNWSLVAVVGDEGSTTLDVVWRKRY